MSLRVSVARAHEDLQDQRYRRFIFDLTTGRGRWTTGQTAMVPSSPMGRMGPPVSRMPPPGVSVGECGGGCCPASGSGADIMSNLQRRVPGMPTSDSRCSYRALSLVNAAVAAGAAAVLAVTALVTLCVTRIEIVTTGAPGFSIQLFTINNEPQFQLNSVFHTDMFAPGSDSNTEFAGDCVSVGSQIQMNVTNLDAVNAQGIFVALRGPTAV